MTHSFKCDIFNQLFNFKAFELKNPICRETLFQSQTDADTQMNRSNLKCAKNGKTQSMKEGEEKRNDKSFHLQLRVGKSFFSASNWKESRNIYIHVLRSAVRFECNAFISRWNIAIENFFERKKKLTNRIDARNKSRITPKSLPRRQHTRNICICYVKIINFKIGFIKMYEFEQVLGENGYVVLWWNVRVCVEVSWASERNAHHCWDGILENRIST